MEDKVKMLERQQASHEKVCTAGTSLTNQPHYSLFLVSDLPTRKIKGTKWLARETRPAVKCVVGPGLRSSAQNESSSLL